MKYRFVFTKSLIGSLPAPVEFEAPSDMPAYWYVIDEIILAEGGFEPSPNPCTQGTLEKMGAFGWEALMIWERGPGWRFPSQKDTGLVDKRIAPGA